MTVKYHWIVWYGIMKPDSSACLLMTLGSHQIWSVWVGKTGYLFWLCTSQCIIGHEYGWQHGPRVPRSPILPVWSPSLIFHLIFWEAQSVTTGYARVRQIAHWKRCRVGVYKRYRYVISRSCCVKLIDMWRTCLTLWMIFPMQIYHTEQLKVMMLSEFRFESPVS